MTSPAQHTLAITAAESGERLDKALSSRLPELSRARIQTLIELGHVMRDTPKGSEKAQDASRKVRAGEMYTVIVPPLEASRIEAQEIALNVVYEDAHLLVINKAAGMTVHPAPGSPDKTLVNALLAHCGGSLSGIGGVARPGIVHRIDKDTSGLLVVAKHDAAHHHLSAQLSERTLKRTYLAVCHGAPSPPQGTITGNIGRHPKHRQKMAVVSGGKHAATHYKVVWSSPPKRSGERGSHSMPSAIPARASLGGEYALVECNLETGRTHQIRVHMQHIGHPLVGDATYGKKSPSAMHQSLSTFSRQALHAWKLRLIHPHTGEEMEFTAEMPGDMRRLLEELRG